MSLTVRELIAIPTLGTRVLAGAAGIDRQVDWAHSCELPEPWHWMGGGDLLMTVGHGFPPGADEQVTYLEHLAEANLSGLALAEGLFAPPVTDEAARAADRLAFPILETAYEIPFVMVARAVADSNQREAQARLTRVLRMYDTFRQATADAASDAEVFARLGRDVGATLHVLDLAESAVVVSNAALADDAVVEVLAQLRSREGPLPAVVRLTAAGQRFVVLPLATGARWALAAVVEDQVVDLVVLQHAATIAHIQLERRRTSDLVRLHAGARLLHQIMSGRMDSELAAQQLREYGVQGPPWWMVLIDDQGQSEVLSIQRRLLANAVPHLMDRTDGGLLMVIDIAPDPETFRVLALSAEVRIGVSDPVNALSRLTEAAREARWALEAASAGVPIARHGLDHSLFLPRTVREGDMVVARVLGPISDYDAEHGSGLLESLQAFFAAQRSWQAAARQLCIHKQTLIYRMRRVEEITGRKLDQLDDIAEIHLALRTRELLARKASPQS